MKKKSLTRLAAVSIAGLTAVSSMGITASALVNNNGYASGSIFQVNVTTTASNGLTSTNTYYYTSKETADAAVKGIAGTVSIAEKTVNSVYNVGSTIYVDSTGRITTNNTAGTKLTVLSNGSSSSPTITVPSYSSIHYASSTGYIYLGSDGRRYPNRASVYAAGQTVAATEKPGVSYETARASSATGNVYFDMKVGSYTDVYTADCVQIYSSTNSYDYNYDYRTDYDTYDVYKVNGVYYPTLSSALSAAGNNYSYITKIYDYSKPQTDYFSKVTGRYYATYSAALAASGNNSSNVVDMNYYNYTNDYYYDYYYGSTYDPYYYYLLQQRYGKTDKDDDSSSSSSDTTSAAIGKRKGWTNIAKYLGNLKSGSSVSVDMNYETSVPSSVMTAIKGKNITVKFVLDNGVTFTINGKDVSSAYTIDMDTAYNTKFIPSKLVKAAYKKNDAVSTAQISVDGNSFGASADVTVKFATKRAGCSAKLYRYNSAQNKLVLVDTAKVQSNGKCTFGDVTSGGNFLIVLY